MSDIRWYQDGNEVLQPLRFHVNELLEYIEREQMPPPRVIKEARKASKKAEDFFVPNIVGYKTTEGNKNGLS